jgi:hypothetical protein
LVVVFSSSGTGLANYTHDHPFRGTNRVGEFAVTAFDLTIWLPALFVLGLAAMGLMFAFIAGCAKV